MTQARTVGVAPPLTRTPPPPFTLSTGEPAPPVMVNPSTTVVSGSPEAMVTALVPRPVALMTVTAAPPVERSTTSLPSRSTASE